MGLFSKRELKAKENDFICKAGSNGIKLVRIDLYSQAFKNELDDIEKSLTAVEREHLESRKDNLQTIGGIYAARLAFCHAFKDSFATDTAVYCDEREVSLSYDSEGCPFYMLSGFTKHSFESKLPYSEARVSVSHDDKYVYAVCMISLDASKVQGDLTYRVGVDCVKVQRLEKPTDSLLRRILSSREYESFKEKNDAKLFAGLFAAKEAFLKALGLGMFKGIRLNEITVSFDKEQGLFYELEAQAKNVIQPYGLCSAVKLLYNTEGYAVAICRVVLVETKRYEESFRKYGKPELEFEPQSRITELAEQAEETELLPI